MELQLGLKITRTPHDFASTSDVWFPNDGARPRFESKETDTAIVLTGYLKGYRGENINIKINEHGTRIVIGGEKPVQEMIMMGWIMLKKQVEMREFRKVFRIPDGVALNRIKAKFNVDGSVLTIHFPKLIKGIIGIVIDEEPEETDGRILEMESSGIVDEILLNKEDELISSVEETRRIAEDDIREKQAEFIDKSIETSEETNEYQEKVEESTIAGANAEQNDKDSVAEMESREAAREITDASINIPDSNDHQRETHEAIDEKEEEQATTTGESVTKEAENENDEGEKQKKRKLLKEIENNETISSSKTQEKNEALEEEQTEETRKIVQEQQKDRKKEREIQEKVEKRTCKCNPFVIAGSAFLASSLVVIVLGFVRAKRKDKK